MAQVSEDHFTGHLSSRFHAFSSLEIFFSLSFKVQCIEFLRDALIVVYVSIWEGRQKRSRNSLWFISRVPSSTFLHFILYLVHLGIMVGAVIFWGQSIDLHPDIKLTTPWREFISNVVQVSK